MSGPEADGTKAKSRRPRSMQFRKRSTSAPPTPDQARRQSDIVQSTWRRFGATGPVIAFLNTRHASLEAQPLHLAIESDEGLRRVEALLDALEGESELDGASLGIAGARHETEEQAWDNEGGHFSSSTRHDHTHTARKASI